ncbi:MAG: hypothetical protein AVDCRST_MAG57-1984 [uncultured Blastococcus sp.]|uniref:Uncharacterized protein n=1 Tax=uncultured Blastococcus sp. TaxID=217144 RepID=A0A6J4IEG7_9ACTN|nr:MAG: hypothetical protein AVDCRST_MAG57-1984 [uncultured Blastococcus sp.]
MVALDSRLGSAGSGPGVVLTPPRSSAASGRAGRDASRPARPPGTRRSSARRRSG